LVTVWTAESRDKDGVPVRDEGSVSYPASIESAAEADTATCCAARGQAAYEAASGAYRYERRRAEGYQLFEHDDGGGSAYAEAAGDGEAMQSEQAALVHHDDGFGIPLRFFGMAVFSIWLPGDLPGSEF
jgi:hypothetical protein